MSKLYKTYIDRSGKMPKLDKSIDHMVVNALPDHIDHSVVSTSNQVSPYSSRINTSEIELDSPMERNRNMAATHHAYNDCWKLITPDLTRLDLGEMNRWALKIAST